MSETDMLHVGRDGVSLRGRDTIVIFILLVLSATLTWLLWTHMEKDEQRGSMISQRMEVMKQEHALLRDSIDSNTEALHGVTDQMELQSWLMIADPKEEQFARKHIGVPKLLGGNNPYPIRP